MNISVVGDKEGIYEKTEAYKKALLLGYEIEILEADLPENLLNDKLRAAHILVIMRERLKVDKSLLLSMPNLRHISQTGKGLKHIDQEALKDKNITISTTPGESAHSVAELTLAMILALARNFPVHHKGAQADEWEPIPGKELKDKTIGILGYGNVGQKVAGVAEALGMNVLVWRPLNTSTQPEHGHLVDLHELLKKADIVTIHMRFSSEWHGYLDTELLSLLKKESILINTSRAEIIERTALERLLEDQKLFGIGLDVFHDEPADFTLYQNQKNGIFTPHVGFVTYECLARFAEASMNNAIKAGANISTQT
jgi:D-3-phosphoglycerate dehydrogenase / 2-oxoglutarate reductase